MTTPSREAAINADERTALDVLFDPKSIAVIGASTNPEALGGRPVAYLTNYGYAGKLYVINVRSPVVQGVPAYASVLDVPGPVDVALVAVPARAVPEVLSECVDAGVRIAVVMSSGFGEGMGAGAELSRELEAIRSATTMRVLGPNCEGLASLPSAAPMTFSPVFDVRRSGNVVREGNVAVVSQSGGLGFAIAQWGTDVGLGFNYIVTTGNELDIDTLEVARHLAGDPGTETVVVLVEGFKHVSEFESIAAHFQQLGKTLILAKIGRSPAGARGAYAHTMHTSGNFDEYRSVVNQFGVLSAHDENELIDILQTVSKSKPSNGRRVGIITTSGGAGVWVADACTAAGFEIPLLSAGVRDTLASCMPEYGSSQNPVDLTAQFVVGGAFAPAIEMVMESGEVDAVILATSLSSSGRLAGDKDALKRLTERHDVPLLVYTYTRPVESCVTILNDLGLPWYSSSVRVARGLNAITAGVEQ